MLVASLVRVTCTAGTTPLASCTAPRTPPVNCCAVATLPTASARNAPMKPTRILMAPSDLFGADQGRNPAVSHCRCERSCFGGDSRARVTRVQQVLRKQNGAPRGAPFCCLELELPWPESSLQRRAQCAPGFFASNLIALSIIAFVPNSVVPAGNLFPLTT